LNKIKGLKMSDTDKPYPTQIELHQKSRVLEIGFSDGKLFSLPYEFLRVYSPSAEVRGHGPGQETLQVGKMDVEISEAQAVGTYAINFLFSDGHDSGIYSWETLHSMGENKDSMWQDYLKRMEEAGAKREPAPNILTASKGGCGSGSGGGCGSGGCGSK
jgi:DUF971 family protein